MRTAALPRAIPLPHLRRRAIAIAALAALALVPFGLWLRHSPVVGASNIEITGTSGAQSASIREAIREAAHGMSTVAPSPQKITDALTRYPIVRDVDVRGHFPHTLAVTVHQYTPVAALSFAGHREAVASDGTLLPSVSTEGLPPVAVSGAPTGHILTETKALRMVALLGAAPTAFLRHIHGVSVNGSDLTVSLSNGPKLYFGPATRLHAKWISAARVLADTSSHGAHYIDVRVPESPAAGGLEPVNSQVEVQTSG